MKAVFALAAICFIAYALLNMWRRPGFLAAAFVGSYGLAVFFGPLGTALGAVALFAPVSIWATRATSRFKSPPPELALMLWALFSILTLFGSLHYGVSAHYVSALIGLAGGAYLMGRTFGDEEGFVRDLIIGAALVMLICAPAILASTTNKGVLGTDLNSVGLAVLLEIPLTGAMAVAVLGEKLRARWRWAAIGLIFFVIIPFAFALANRSVMLAAAIVFLFFLAVRIHKGNARGILLATAGAFLVLGGIGLLAMTELKHVAGFRILSLGVQRLIANITNSHSGHVYIDPSVAGRLKLYDDAFGLIRDAPLFGHGIGSFGYLTDYQGLDSYPHNLFLEILVSTGLVGLALFLAALVPLGWYAVRRAWAREGGWEDAFIAALLGETLLRHQVSMSVMTGKVLFLSFGIVALRWAGELRRQREEGAPQEALAGPGPAMAIPGEDSSST